VTHGEIRNAAIRLLARREHSTGELTRKLHQKGFDVTAIETVLRDLRQENLLSDERFAESFVASRIERGSGPVRIAAELRQREVADELIERCLAAVDEDWAARAEVVRRKRFGRGKPDNFAERAKQARFLQYRGFRGEHLRGVFGDEDVEAVVSDDDGEL
jgi:regulatory protein